MCLLLTLLRLKCRPTGNKSVFQFVKLVNIVACLALLVFPRSNRPGVFSFYTGCLPIAFYLHISFEIILFLFSVQIWQTQSLFSKYYDLVLKRIISLYCFRRIVENFQNDILKESTNKTKENKTKIRTKKRKFLPTGW